MQPHLIYFIPSLISRQLDAPLATIFVRRILPGGNDTFLLLTLVQITPNGVKDRL